MKFSFGAQAVWWCSLGLALFLVGKKLLFLYCFLWLFINQKAVSQAQCRRRG